MGFKYLALEQKLWNIRVEIVFIFAVSKSHQQIPINNNGKAPRFAATMEPDF